MPRAKAAPALAVVTSSQTPNPFSAHRRTPDRLEENAGPLWISPDDAAAQLGITVEALKKRAKQGLLGFKEGARWRFSSGDLKRYTATIESRHLRALPRH